MRLDLYTYQFLHNSPVALFHKNLTMNGFQNSNAMLPTSICHFSFSSFYLLLHRPIYFHETQFYDWPWFFIHNLFFLRLDFRHFKWIRVTASTSLLLRFHDCNFVYERLRRIRFLLVRVLRFTVDPEVWFGSSGATNVKRRREHSAAL